MPNDLMGALDDKMAAVGTSQRFEFGKNWQRFLHSLNEQRISLAENSLCSMLDRQISARSFLDVGCGSGLFSLAAMRRGAERVHSFDYDLRSVACAAELKRRFFSGASNWTIERGDILDAEYLAGLGQFDVVYSWGVLHHTGRMWQALGNVVPLVRPGGKLFIAIYNDQGFRSRLWKKVKRLYNQGPGWRFLLVPSFCSYFGLRLFAKDLLSLRDPFDRYRRTADSRGMAFFTDVLDWLGGYPFEVAKPEEIFDFFRSKGFELERLKTAGVNHGNNEFVFRKCAE